MPKYVPIEDLTLEQDITDDTLIPVSDGERSFAVTAKAFKFFAEVNGAGAQAIIDAFDSLKATVESLKSAVGSPLVATTAAGMTDTDKVYVYTGSESGWNNGHWYYFDSTTSLWTDGGVYNAVAVNTDPSLSVSGAAADAKAAGDRTDTSAGQVQALAGAISGFERKLTTLNAGGINTNTGVNNTLTTRCRSGYTVARPRVVELTSGEYEMMVYYYASGDASSGISREEYNGSAWAAGPVRLVLNPPEGATRFRVCFRRVDGAELTTDPNDETSDYYKIMQAFTMYDPTDTSLEKGYAPADAAAVGTRFAALEDNLKAVYPIEFLGATNSLDYPYGWTTGYINTSGNATSSNTSMRMWAAFSLPYNGKLIVTTPGDETTIRLGQRVDGVFSYRDADGGSAVFDVMANVNYSLSLIDFGEMDTSELIDDLEYLKGISIEWSFAGGSAGTLYAPFDYTKFRLSGNAILGYITAAGQIDGARIWRHLLPITVIDPNVRLLKVTSTLVGVIVMDTYNHVPIQRYGGNAVKELSVPVTYGHSYVICARLAEPSDDTKSFDDLGITVEFLAADADQYKQRKAEFERFYVKTNLSWPDTSDTSSGNAEPENEANVRCVLALPTSYLPIGKATPLIMFCHGASCQITDTSWYGSGSNFLAMIRACTAAGYAVFDVNNTRDMEGGFLDWGSLPLMTAYIRAWEYIKANYNVEHRLYLLSDSMGTAANLNMLKWYPSEIVTSIMTAPRPILKERYISGTDSGKKQLLVAFGVEDDSILDDDSFVPPDESVFDAQPLKSFNHYENIVTIGDEGYVFERFPPVKVMVGTGDTAHLEETRAYYKALANAGNYVNYREVAGATHANMSFLGIGNLKDEMVAWFDRFRYQEAADEGGEA